MIVGGAPDPGDGTSLGFSCSFAGSFGFGSSFGFSSALIVSFLLLVMAVCEITCEQDQAPPRDLRCCDVE